MRWDLETYALGILGHPTVGQYNDGHHSGHGTDCCCRKSVGFAGSSVESVGHALEEGERFLPCLLFPIVLSNG